MKKRLEEYRGNRRPLRIEIRITPLDKKIFTCEKIKGVFSLATYAKIIKMKGMTLGGI